MVEIKSGLNLDRPPLSSAPYWRFGFNVRSNQGRIETLGLFGPMMTAGGGDPANQVQLEVPTTSTVRSVMVCPGVLAGQIMLGASDGVWAAIFNPASTVATGTCFALHNVTPTSLTPAADVVAVPSSGRVDIPPVWWFVETTDVIIGMRANVDEPAYYWDRLGASLFKPLANCPHGAVAGAIVGRILVLFGAQSISDPTPSRYLTIRWSDRFDYEDWTPSDVNVSGELQLEGGSRIIGGGAITQGMICWTDKNMALLTETGDPDSVFARKYVDGGRGLMCNKAWIEADGVVWWWDETMNLNSWAGGQPSQIMCPVRAGTVMRMTDSDLSRAYMVANPEYGEVILWYPDSDGVMWTGLVYSYVDQVWSIWRLQRPAWGQRVGVTHNVGVDNSGKMFAHDLDAAIEATELPGLAASSPYKVLSNITPYDWSLNTNLITPEGPLDKAHHLTQLLVDNMPARSTTGGSDAITATVTGYGDYKRDPAKAYAETQVLPADTGRASFRVEGKCIELKLFGTNCTTLWRTGEIEVILEPTASR